MASCTRATQQELTRPSGLGIRLVLFLILAGTVASVADARPRKGGHRGGFHGGRAFVTIGYYSPFHYGFGRFYSPWYAPYAYRGPHRGGDRMNPALARALDVGAIDVDIKPGKAEVWVDGEYYGQARDFNGYPSYLWLDEGEHVLTVYRGGYVTFEETIAVEPGLVRRLKFKLQEGKSTPPAPAS